MVFLPKTRGHGGRGVALVVATLLLGVLAAMPARAVPSFSDQTGEACSACHVGAFGPQLTAHGRAFKLTGYSDGQASRQFPLVSGMAELSLTHTAQGQEGGAASGFGPNNNGAVDQVSVFVAGRLYDHLGVFSQTTWDGVGHHIAWDNTDLRYGREATLAGLESILGLSVNNSPTVSDPYNTTPAWGFPYAAAKLAPHPAAATLIEGGLAQRVVGMTAYGLFADLLYVEAGGYRALGGGPLNTLGVAIADGQVVDGTVPYARLALQHEDLQQSAALGVFGLSAHVFPNNDRSAGTDRYTDVGVDASYQWHPNRNHTLGANATAILETHSLPASVALGLADSASGHLNSYRLNTYYTFQQTYGLTAGVFRSTGSGDAALYGSDPLTGSANGKPNSSGYVLQADWTPFGKTDSWAAPWVNLRLALQYTGYTQFNGASRNYDGTGRNASDNNTLWLLTWLAF
ncbi:cytochrome C [Nitrospirillum pindoramense]|uniref:Cytochrome c domain-containing protein n=1 Tax=Nitrospirillum amazonense TaxID=28077 RepID=A0A560GUH7_9PROT|nr:cytochrome C [Nitrospirillum amazonense]TWB37686.1 hypothetical protein FBZ90_114175 [Nitrospirillum amazonense]